VSTPPPGYPGPQYPPGTPQPGVYPSAPTGAFGQPQVPGQQPYAQQPYGHGYPFGQPQQPAYGQVLGYGTPYPAPPSPPKKSRTWLWILIGVGMVLVAALAGVLVVVATKGKVTDADDVAIGDCLRVTESASSVKANEVDCGTEEFHFAVVSKTQDRTACGDYSQLWFTGLSGDRSGEVLCLAPIMREGSCYQFPTVETDTALADFNDAACGSNPTVTGARVLRVESKVSSQPSCPRGQVPLFMARPTPAGYCLAEVTDEWQS